LYVYKYIYLSLILLHDEMQFETYWCTNSCFFWFLLYAHKYVYLSSILSHDEMQFEMYRCMNSCFLVLVVCIYKYIFVLDTFARWDAIWNIQEHKFLFFFGCMHISMYTCPLLSHDEMQFVMYRCTNSCFLVWLLYVYTYVYIFLTLSHDEIQFEMYRCTNSSCLCCGIYVNTHMCFWYFRATKRNLKYTGARTPVFWFCCKYIYLFLILARDDDSFVRTTWRIHSFWISHDQGNFSRALALVFFPMLMRVVWHTSMRHVARTNECVMSQCVHVSLGMTQSFVRATCRVCRYTKYSSVDVRL